MANLDPRIEAVREKYGLDRDDFWQIPQNKQWVCKHAALEIVATKANVEWSSPQIIQADTEAGIAVMSVTGKMGNRVEWSTGEASPKNNKNAYPWAMAEKRAKDRVILKLAGIHGLVYSEDEMSPEEPRTTDKRSETGRREAARQQELGKPISSAENKRQLETISAELIDARTPGEVVKLMNIWADTAEKEGWSKDYWDEARRRFARRKKEIEDADGRITDVSGRELSNAEAA
jgi:hypothetical protein